MNECDIIILQYRSLINIGRGTAPINKSLRLIGVLMSWYHFFLQVFTMWLCSWSMVMAVSSPKYLLCRWCRSCDRDLDRLRRGDLDLDLLRLDLQHWVAKHGGHIRVHEWNFFFSFPHHWTDALAFRDDYKSNPNYQAPYFCLTRTHS